MITHRDIVWLDVKPMITQLQLSNTTNKGKDNNSNRRVLDIGCHDIYFKKPFESLGLDWHGIDKYVPIDDRGNAIGYTEIVHGDMNDIPYDDKTFDLIFCCHAFEHSENPLQTLREFKRVSKRFIIIATPFPNNHHILEADEDHIFCLHENQMERLLRYSGIEKVVCYIQRYSSNKNQWNLITVGIVV